MRDITVDARRAGALGARSSAAIEARRRRARSSTRPTARFLLHVGGKIEQHNKLAAASTRDDLSMAYTPGRRARLRGDRRRTPTRPSSTRSSATRSPSSPTAPPCSASATSGPRAAMPVMEGKAMLFKEFARRRRVPDLPRHQGPGRDRRDRQGDRARPSAASTSRTSRAPRCFEIEDRLKERARHPGLPRRPARHRRRRARRAAERAASSPAAGSRTCACSSSGSAPPASPSRRSCSRRACADIDRLRLARRAPHRARRLPRRLDEPPSSAGTPRHEPRAAATARPADVIDGHGPVHRPLRRARDAARGARRA